MKHLLTIALVIGLFLGLGVFASRRSQSDSVEYLTDAPSERRTLVLSSDLFEIDQAYESMQGPADQISGFALSDRAEDAGRVFWIKSMQVDTENTNGESASNEFFCHANLRFEGPAPLHNSRFENRHHMPKRLLTLTEGRMRIDLPEGFGIPIFADTKLGFDTMSHQLNHKPDAPIPKVRFRASVSYLTTNSESGQELRPLFRRTLYLYDKLNKPDFEKLSQADDEFCTVDVATQGLSRIGNNPIHWSVPPGEHIYELPVSEQLFLPYSTSLHYAAGHFHTHCEWMRLEDRQSGQILLELTGSSYPGKRGMAAISDLASPEGIPMGPDGDYVLKIKYNNPTEKPIDAMGILYLYLLEPSKS